MQVIPNRQSFCFQSRFTFLPNQFTIFQEVRQLHWSVSLFPFCMQSPCFLSINSISTDSFLYWEGHHWDISLNIMLTMTSLWLYSSLHTLLCIRFMLTVTINFIWSRIETLLFKMENDLDCFSVAHPSRNIKISALNIRLFSKMLMEVFSPSLQHFILISKWDTCLSKNVFVTLNSSISTTNTDNELQLE